MSLPSKKLQDSERILQLDFTDSASLIFDYYALNRAVFGRSRIINTYLLTSSQWRGHDLTGAVNNSRGCAKGEANGTLVTFYHNRLSRVITCYRSTGVSGGCGGVCSRCWSIRGCRFLGRGGASLCESQRHNQHTNQTNDCLLHSVSLLLMLMFSQVRDSGVERTLYLRLLPFD
jgi:hypothetical protein